MLNTLLETANRIEDAPENQATTRVPWVWIGFIFPLVFLFSEFLLFIPGVEETQVNGIFLIIVIAAMAFWLFCIYKMHKILNQIAPHGYPVTPGEAVGKHFIPILNAIWVFQWPSEMSQYINGRGRVRMMSGKLIGLLLLLSALLRFVDGAVGLAVTFGVTTYLAVKLRRHVELGKSVILPPPPDQELFGHARTNAAERQIETV
jgi:hypothetical protein